MSISCAVLMCHAPIVIPQIAGAESQHCQRTTEAMRETAAALVAHAPTLIVLVSPHAPRRPDSMGLVFEHEISGDFSRFGHGELHLSLPGSPERAVLVEKHARSHRVSTHSLPGSGLDHGSMVPLFFLHEAGYRGPVLLVSLPYPGAGIEAAFGQALRDAARESGERWAILASGDMSHRLKRNAPAGYDPRAHEFDKAFVHAVEHGDLRRAVAPDEELAELAAEDVVQSTAVAAAAVQYQAHGTHVFSYEAPFGVGYMEAMLYTQQAELLARPRDEPPPYALIDIALAAIEAALQGQSYRPPVLATPWSEPRAVFVTLRAPDGELRGCIGRTEPALSTLADEIADCAVSAATRDPRMESVRRDELSSLDVDVSVLHTPVRIDDPSELDPARYGVVVELGARRGVLLPDIEGIDTPEQQLRIVLRKAGIDGSEPYTLKRFRVDKIARQPPIASA